MQYRQITLLPSKSYSADFVETVDVNTSDPLSEIQIMYKGLNASSTPTEVPAKLITKVEIIDGSSVICALSGVQAEALHYWHHGKMPVSAYNYVNDEYCWTHFSIPFGRWLWDDALALDPKRFRNLQIRVTGDLNGGGAAPDAGILEVVAHAFDDKKINPIGYLRAVQIAAYSLVSSAYETIDIPRDDIIKMIMIQSIARTKAPSEQFNEIKISEDAEKKVPIDQNTADLMKYLMADRDRLTQYIRAVVTTAGLDTYGPFTYEDNWMGTADNGAAGYVTLTQAFGGKANLNVSANANVAAFQNGYAPHGSLAIPFGDPWVAEDWYDPRNLSALKLRIKGGSSILASSTCEVVAQSMKRY